MWKVGKGNGNGTNIYWEALGGHDGKGGEWERNNSGHTRLEGFVTQKGLQPLHVGMDPGLHFCGCMVEVIHILHAMLPKSSSIWISLTWPM